jgi:hypothetical protein
VQQGDSTHRYVGEQAIDLIKTNDTDKGTIADSKFQGGAIEVFGGPWNIAGNTVYGSMAKTYSPGAFALHSPHDVRLLGNQVTQADGEGRAFRLVNLAVSGFNNDIQGNFFGGGAGQTGDELGYSAGTGQFYGINDPEVILAESTYGVLFEGRPAAISPDGRLLFLSNLRATAFPGFTGPGMVVSILAGVGSSGAPVMNAAGEWFRVAQQVSLTSSNTIELLMQDPLPAMPAGGYYVVEVTGGFVNNAFISNTLDMTGRSCTGIVLNGEDYGSRIAGNKFVGGTIYNNVYTGTAINLGAPIASAPAGNGAFPLPAAWTALPNLGTIIEGNTIVDSLGGIVIGVQHAVNYWEARVLTASETGRVYLTAAVTGNAFVYDASFLSAWAASARACGNNPAQNVAPPTVTVGSGFSAEAPGPYGSPRFPWAVGNSITVNASDTPIFVDPIENVVTIQGNATEVIGANGAINTASGWSGQIYCGVVNGSVVSPALPSQTFNNQPYFSFNLGNLDIMAAPAGTNGIQAIMSGQDATDLVGPANGPPAPDGIQDLHLILTGLDPAATITSIEVLGTGPGEDWRYPAAGSTPQMVLQQAAGSSSADLFLASAASHLADRFTIELTTDRAGPIAIPVVGVRFDPRLPVLPAVAPVTSLPPPPGAPLPSPPLAAAPPPPANLIAGLAARNEIALSWSASAGALNYVVERSSYGSAWYVVGAAVPVTSFLDAGLDFSTTYFYRVRAVDNAGSSLASSSVSAQTQSQPDVLSAGSLALTITRGRSFSGAVATLTDANAATGAARFIATINWGDGKTSLGSISGGGGTFVISGSHKYKKVGVFAVRVTVTTSVPGQASASATGTARVAAPARHRPLARVRINHHPLKQSLLTAKQRTR